MYSHNVFAVLTAYDHRNKASSAFKLLENSSWFHRAVEASPRKPTIDGRVVTPAEDLQSEDDEINVVDRLVVTFEELLRIKNLQNGGTAGHEPKCVLYSLRTSKNKEEKEESARSSATLP